MVPVTSPHVKMFTTLLLHVAFIAIVRGGLTREPSLLKSIEENRCMFPPANLQFPSKCSEFTLSYPVGKELLENNDNVSFYLCAAILDSTKRLCPLVKNNNEFRKRVEIALQDAQPTLFSISNDDKFCYEMNYLDPNTTMEQAKFVYELMMKKVLFCDVICGTGKDESVDRQPLCKSIQFAHQQIRAAIDLQKSLNDQAHNPAGMGNPVVLKPGGIEGGDTNVDSMETHNPSAAQVDPKESVPKPMEESLVAREESRTIENKPINENKPSQSASSQVKIKPSQIAASQVKNKPSQSGSSQVQNKPSQSASSQVKDEHGSTKPEISKTITIPTKTSALRVAAPASLQLVAVEKSDGAQSSKTKPADVPSLDDRTEGGEENKEDGREDINPGNADDAQGDPPGEIQNEAPQENQNDGAFADEENLEKPEEDEDPSVNAPQESNKEAAEKPPAVDKKSSNLNEFPIVSHQKVSSELGRTSSQFGNLEETEDSHFFAYFLTMSALCTLGYFVYHNKRKIIAMAVEGKKGRNAGRRRPNSANYHKLDSNLEEAMSSNLTSTNSYVIY